MIAASSLASASRSSPPCFSSTRAEASRYRELGEFLVSVNSQNSLVQSAKCDAWSSRELNEAEEIYGATCKFCSYVDLVFCDTAARANLSQHEQFAKNLT